MVVVTGAAGFLGRTIVWHLNKQGYRDLLLVETRDAMPTMQNVNGIVFSGVMTIDEFVRWEPGRVPVEAVVHFGANSDTLETDVDQVFAQNTEASKAIWRWCAKLNIPCIYASSAATYGMGESGFGDDHASLAALQPVNVYARSKHAFDRWAVEEGVAPPMWVGLKIFNAYGPNECHKGRMASMVYQAFRQIAGTGGVELFATVAGEEPYRRDFVYSKDVAAVVGYFVARAHAGSRCREIVNVGTGVARPFEDAVRAVAHSMGAENWRIRYVPMPSWLEPQYQRVTEASTSKLRALGFKAPLRPLEQGVQDYVRGYLLRGDKQLALDDAW